MMNQVLLLTLILLVVESDAQRSACSINRCSCTPRYDPPHIEVLCYVASITSQDATIKALPGDIEALILHCEGLDSPSVLSDGIFEKMPDLNTLGINNCNISVMTANSFRRLSSLDSLTIHYSGLPELAADTFLHLSTIQFLAINFCNLNKLPAISHLKSLKYLNVSSNNLNEVEITALNDTDNATLDGYLNRLLLIDLSYNNISSMPLDLIARTPLMLVFYLRGLPLTELSIPENMRLRNLRVLNATGSHLVVADLSGLYRASGIVYLRLDGAGKPQQFSGLSNQVYLVELSLNNFAITDTIWQQLNSSNLARLTLTNNNLTSINISHLPALWRLNVARNNISSIKDTTFRNQPNLSFFNISHNRIQELPDNMFQENVTIESLDLSYNNISSLQFGIFSCLIKLKYLDLSSNFISYLAYTFFKDLPLLQVLLLSDNKLRFPPTLSYLLELTMLNISFNQISSISPSDLSGLANLQLLIITNNRLTSIPPNLLSQCPKLLQARLNDNQITTIGTFDAHLQLEFLALQNNQITDFSTPHPFGFQKLEILSLSVNNLTRLSYRMFPPSLLYLYLSANSLENLDNASFSYLPRLLTVSLSYNKRVLSIPSSSVSVFKDQVSKPSFHVQANVFLCDCNMSYLKVISEDNYSIQQFNNPYPLFVGIQDSKCATPFEGGAIRPFKDVPLSHFACEYNVTWCDDICPCCSDDPKCECALSCPSECKCYYGGSGLKKFYIHIHCRSQNLEQIPNGILARTVVLYLDGNNFSHLSKQNFAHLQNAEDIYLNSSYIKSADNGTFENISALKSLSLNDNQLTSIDDNFLGRLPSVKQIYLHNNLIDTISSEAFSQLSSVETITLHNNRLMFLKAVLKIPHPISLTLSGNPWSCNCDVSKVLMRTFYEIKASIADNEELCCSFLRDLASGEKIMVAANRKRRSNASSPVEITGDKQLLVSFEDDSSTTRNPRQQLSPPLGLQLPGLLQGGGSRPDILEVHGHS